MVNLPQNDVTFWKAAKPSWPMHYQRLRATAREDGAVSINLGVVESSVTGKNRPSFINLHGVVVQEFLPDGS
ncbi:hypothetical protein E4U60_005074 [Claviceps pazoutovae]|uniref:Uncharacterized protein n=1 Tax=Claviceps pazoutovae TaxID=1649127 RepID=A0A9P7M8C2_9HYPO|nr:hypothetical protein E4U60_005074 [Claviceps pazoutovae]